MPGHKELRSIRFRLEAVNGTPVAPRFVWRGNGASIEDAREVTMVEEQVGIVGGTDRSYIGKLIANLELDETPATFEQLGDLFLMHGFGTVGGAANGSAQGASGSTVIRQVVIPAGTFFPTLSYSAEAGDDAEAEVMPYVLATETTLKGVGGEAITVSSKLIGAYGTRTNASGSFSNAGTVVAVEDILTSNGSMWLSPEGAAFGVGPVTSGNILGFEVTFKSMWEPKYSADAGILYPVTFVLGNVEIEGNFTYEHQVSGTFGAAGSAGQKEKWRNQLAQMWRARFPGGAITAGTTHLTKLLEIDLPIKYTSWDVLDDQNGNDIVTANWVSKYNINTPAAGRGTIVTVRLGTAEFAGAN